MKEIQSQFVPFKCELNNCTKDAVCAIQNKYNPDLHFNVCADCYEKTTGKKWEGVALAA